MISLTHQLFSINLKAMRAIFIFITFISLFISYELISADDIIDLHRVDTFICSHAKDIELAPHSVGKSSYLMICNNKNIKLKSPLQYRWLEADRKPFKFIGAEIDKHKNSIICKYQTEAGNKNSKNKNPKFDTADTINLAQILDNDPMPKQVDNWNDFKNSNIEVCNGSPEDCAITIR